MSVAEAFVTVRPDMDKFGGELKGGLGRLAGVAKAGGLLIGAALVGAGTAAFKIGQEFHQATNTIRLGTGATGEALAGLQDSFRNVAARVPADFGQVSTAVADLNTRLGLTGPELEAVSREFLDLARITGGDVSSQIALGTRVLGDWDISAGATSETLDKLWRASQASGAGIEQLMGQVVQFGAPLRGMGFSLEESVALFAKFEKEGVNAELVVGSLRQALGRMAREGEDAPETFRRMVDEIQKMEDPTKATAAAMELFGARAGPDMAAAIREGRFDLQEMLDAIENGSDTVSAAAADTRGFTEAWQLFKNNAMLALEPIAVRVFGLLSTKMEQFAAWWQSNGPAVRARIEELGVRFGEFAARIRVWWNDTAKPALNEFFAAVRTHWPTIQSIGRNLMDMFRALGDVAKAVMDLVAAVFGTTTRTVDGHARTMESRVGGVVRALELLSGAASRMAQGVSSRTNLLAGAFTRDMDRMGRAISDMSGGRLPRLTVSFSTTMGNMTVATRRGVNDIVAWFQGLPGRIRSAIGNAGNILAGVGRDIISGLFAGMRRQWDASRGWLSSRAAEIRNLKGPIEKDRVLLEDIGEVIIGGLGRGMENEWRKVDQLLGTMTAEIPLTVQGAQEHPSGLSGPMSRYEIVVDDRNATARQVAQAIARNEFQQRTLGV